MKYHLEMNYSKAWGVFRWLPSPRRVSECVTLCMLVAAVVVTSWTSSLKSGSPPLWSEHFSEGLGVGDSWNSTPIRVTGRCISVFKKNPGHIHSATPRNRVDTVLETPVFSPSEALEEWYLDILQMYLTGLETFEFSFGKVLWSTVWCTGSSATRWIINWAKGFSLSTL